MNRFLWFLILFICNVSIAQLTKITSFSNETPFDRSNSNKVATVGDRYYFVADEGGFGNELWATDNSPLGAYLVKDITSGAGSTILSNFVSHQGLLYFFANGGTSGEELWRSDGTSNGTYLVKDVNSLNTSLLELKSDNEFLYFFPFTNQNGNEIWKSDGTINGTQLLKDINPGSKSSEGNNMFLFKNKLHFFAKSNNFESMELWSTDGTYTGTKKIKLLNEKGLVEYNTKVAVNDSIFYFTMKTGFYDQLWISDGSSQNTRVVKENLPSVAEIEVLANKTAIFSVKSGLNLDDIWMTDGTNDGTKVLLDLDHQVKKTPFSIIKYKNNAYILANSADNCLLVKTDGTTSGTKIISKFLATSGTENEKLIAFKDVSFVVAFKENNTRLEIFSSDETGDIIYPLIINNEFNGRSPIPSDFRELSPSSIIFKADDSFAGRELYRHKIKAPLTAQIIVQKVIACIGDKNGALDAFVFGGNPPYTYKWSNGAITKKIENLDAGFYTLNVTDSLGNTFVVESFLKEPNPLSVEFISISETLYQKNGSLEAIVTGGTPPYQYKWNNNSQSIFQSNIQAGTYSVTVIDGNNCNISASQMVKRISEFPLTAEIINNNVIKCHGANTGELIVNPSGGFAPYEIKWSNGEFGTKIQNLTAGKYFLTVTDSVGTIVNKQIEINQPEPILIDPKITPEVMYQKNGSLELVVSGGTFPFSYNWSNGEITKDLSNLTSSSYVVTVTDNNACSIVASYKVKRVSQVPLSGEIKTNQLIKCYGISAGELEVSPEGGISPYQYKWSNGSIEKKINNLSAGSYEVTVTDSLETKFVLIGSLNQPPTLEILFNSTPDVDNKNNGDLQVIVTGGVPPFSYLWNSGKTSDQISNLVAGIYTVTVTDANGCEIFNSAEIAQVSGVIDNLSCAFILNTILTTSLIIQACNVPEMSFRLNDLSGKLIFSESLSGPFTYDISRYPKGIYYITFYSKTQKRIYQKKLVII